MFNDNEKFKSSLCQVLVICGISKWWVPLQDSKQRKSHRDGENYDSKLPDVSICTTHPLSGVASVVTPGIRKPACHPDDP